MLRSIASHGTDMIDDPSLEIDERANHVEG
jgi:hypothetical protein